MGKKDPRVDAFIAKSAAFAKPVLEHLRDVVHRTVPDVEETIKWGMPFFTTNGQLLANMAAFKAHVSFGLWKAKLLSDPKGLLSGGGNTGMGHFGKITGLADLPKDAVLSGFIRQAAALNAEGAPKPVKPKKAGPAKKVVVPPALKKALSKNAKANATFDAFSPSHKRAYTEWIDEAKTEATRDKRVATAVEWMAEGKARMWKYER